MKYIDYAVEAIKLAYLSHTPIVWLVTPTMETANDIAIAFANEHFGGLRVPISGFNGSSKYVYYSLDKFGSESKDCVRPRISFDWLSDLDKNGKNLKLSLEKFVVKHQSLETIIEKHDGTEIDANSQDAYLHSMIIIAYPETPDMGWLNRYINVIYVGSPQDNEIEGSIRCFLEKNNVNIDDSFIEQLVVNFRGVSEREIREVLSKCLTLEFFDIDSNDSRNNILDEVRELKRQMLDGFNGLKWVPINNNESPASGLGAITSWLTERKEIFSDPENKQREGYDVPKGVLVTGIPGTGKSLMAKEAARILKLPLIAMDLGDLQEGIVGKSEEHMAKALRMVDAMAPCILWIDEIEKAFSGANSGQSDGGVMRRMFGKFLTWMQEKQSFCFVFATSNNITQLPPELFRSERFDEKFYNFMPSVEECADIFVSHIRFHNEKYALSNQNKVLFDGALIQKNYWIDFLNEQITNTISENNYEDIVELNRDGKWSSGYIPQKKLFTGADISTFVKILKFRILKEREKPEYGYVHSGAITKIEVDSIINQVLKDFMPYGQTNLNDIAKCFLTLSKNRFRPASQLSKKEQIVDFDDFSEETSIMKYDALRFGDIPYNRVLYRCIVGAINNLQKSK